MSVRRTEAWRLGPAHRKEAARSDATARLSAVPVRQPSAYSSRAAAEYGAGLTIALTLIC